MAKKSKIVAQKKREKLVAQYAEACGIKARA